MAMETPWLKTQKISISLVKSPDFAAGARAELVHVESTAALDAAQPSKARSEVPLEAAEVGKSWEVYCICLYGGFMTFSIVFLK